MRSFEAVPSNPVGLYSSELSQVFLSGFSFFSQTLLSFYLAEHWFDLTAASSKGVKVVVYSKRIYCLHAVIGPGLFIISCGHETQHSGQRV